MRISCSLSPDRDPAGAIHLRIGAPKGPVDRGCPSAGAHVYSGSGAAARTGRRRMSASEAIAHTKATYGHRLLGNSGTG